MGTERDEARLLSGNRPEREKLTVTVGMFEESCLLSVFSSVCVCVCFLQAATTTSAMDYLRFLSCARVSASVCVSVMRILGPQLYLLCALDL